MEDLKQIANSIITHRGLETNKEIYNKAIGRSNVKLADTEDIFWITNYENNGTNIAIRDFVGNVVGHSHGNTQTLKEHGKPIYKYTKLGEILIRNYEGNHEFPTPNGKLLIQIFNRASYVPDEEGDALDLKVNISGESKTYQYKSIRELLKEIKELEDQIVDLRKQEEEEKNRDTIRAIEEEIKEKEKELIVKKSSAQAFIIKNAEIRYTPVPDPFQDEVMRSNIFKGTLLIDGGPGTGKTTLLIKRTKFLTAKSIDEYAPNLSPEQKSILFDEQKNWIFFSPSNLLQLYLRNNMIKEGLHASDEKVKVWADYKKELCIQYKLFNSETQRPFLPFNREGGYIRHDREAVQQLSDDFDSYYLAEQIGKLKSVMEIDVSRFFWKQIGSSIQKYLLEYRKLSNWGDYFRLCINLADNFREEVLVFIKQYNDLVSAVAATYLSKVRADYVLHKKMHEYIDGLNKVTSEEEDEVEEEEAEDFEDLGGQASGDKDIALHRKLKTVCRKLALRKYDSTTKMQKADREIVELLPSLQENEEYDTLGQLAFLIKYFKRIIAEPVKNVLGEIPKTYKQFRKSKMETVLTVSGAEFLKEILKDRNRRIHKDEQAFLLYKINTAVRSLYSVSPKLYKESNHGYIVAFQGYTKAVIGIDEASDFSIVDILCMHSLRNPAIASVTLSGDLMQRMTSEGITQWSDLNSFVSEMDLRNLLISYRQSPTLHALAKAIYHGATGLNTDYKTYADRDPKEPKPLAYFSENEEEKIDWIANRIREIRIAHDKMIPSIAIFLFSNHEVFTKKLNSHDAIVDDGLNVVYCRDGQVLGDKNSIRVFPIEYIKGLEFEAVFFHDIDSYGSQDIDDNMLIRYLYVGLSRATFYLGITGVTFPPVLSEVKDQFGSGNWKI